MRKHLTVIIPFSLPWEWLADYQRQTCLELASRGINVIAYMANMGSFLGTGKKTALPTIKNIQFVTPLYLIPFRRIHLIEILNQRLAFLYLLIRTKIFSQKVLLWTFDPYFHWMPNVGAGLAISLYDCVDYHRASQLADSNYADQEHALINSSDFFFTNSKILHALHSKVRASVVVPQGCAINELQSQKIKKQKKITPIVGFIGGINNRIDYHLLYQLAKRFTSLQWQLYGSIQQTQPWSHRQKQYFAKLRTLPNVTFGGNMNRTSLINKLANFDVGIIPYDVSQKFNLYCYPMKVFECFYFGIPVVSTPIVELKRFPELVTISRDLKEWEQAIKKLTTSTWPNKMKKRQRKLATANSWKHKIDAIFKEMNMS